MAIDIDPKSVDAYNNRGIAYHDRADADHKKAIGIDPKLTTGQ